MKGKREALILASYEYEDPKIDQLIAPPQDAADLARVLQDPNIGGFEVREVINKAHHDVEPAIEEFFDKRMRDDLLLLYFSGHGIKDENNRLYLATRNTRTEKLRSTAVSSEFIHDVLKGCNSTKVVVILDCCYSGAFPNGKAKGDKKIETRQLFGGRGRVALMASDETEYSFEGDEVKGVGKRSIFTNTLIKGLESGEADCDGDGYVSVDDIFDYALDRIRPQMNPRIWYDEDYNYEGIYIAKSRRGPFGQTDRPASRHRVCINKKCGGMLRQGANFCHICGVVAPNDKVRREQRCPDCSTPKRAGAYFCPHCGCDWNKSANYSS